MLRPAVLGSRLCKRQSAVDLRNKGEREVCSIKDMIDMILAEGRLIN